MDKRTRRLILSVAYLAIDSVGRLRLKSKREIAEYVKTLLPRAYPRFRNRQNVPCLRTLLTLVDEALALVPDKQTQERVNRLREKYDRYALGPLDIVEVDATPIDKEMCKELGIDFIADELGEPLDVNVINGTDRYTKFVLGSMVLPCRPTIIHTLRFLAQAMQGLTKTGIRFCQIFKELRVDLGTENPVSRLRECIHHGLGCKATFARKGSPQDKTDVERSHYLIRRKLVLPESNIMESSDGLRYVRFVDFSAAYIKARNNHNRAERRDRNRISPDELFRKNLHKLRRDCSSRIRQGIYFRANHVAVSNCTFSLLGRTYYAPEAEGYTHVDCRVLVTETGFPVQIFVPMRNEIIGTYMPKQQHEELENG